MGSSNGKESRYQNVILTFSDESVAVFSGKVACEPGDSRIIVGIQFTEPKEIPDEMYWSDE